MKFSLKKAVSFALGGPIGFLNYSAYEEQKQANKLQKQAQAEQRQLIAKQEAEALETRKQLINQQREQLNIGGYNTYGTSTTGMSGVRGYIGDKLG